jgi:hypothetical protein
VKSPIGVCVAIERLNPLQKQLGVVSARRKPERFRRIGKMGGPIRPGRGEAAYDYRLTLIQSVIHRLLLCLNCAAFGNPLDGCLMGT